VEIIFLRSLGSLPRFSVVVQPHLCSPCGRRAVPQSGDRRSPYHLASQKPASYVFVRERPMRVCPTPPVHRGRTHRKCEQAFRNLFGHQRSKFQILTLTPLQSRRGAQMSLCHNARTINPFRGRPKPQRKLRERRIPRESREVQRLRRKFDVLLRFARLSDPMRILEVEPVGRDRIVKTNHGNFRVHSKGGITGPFPGEPLPLTRAAIAYACGPDGWFSCVRRTKYNCSPIPVGRKWDLRLTQILTFRVQTV
jgi:hypothetical protein